MLRDATQADFAAVLRLNAESENFLSPMPAARLEQLHWAASFHRVAESAGEVVAFLLAFREGADYDSVNYQWFVQRYPRFIYIDRVVVSSHHQGRGWGRTLYQDIFRLARESAVEDVTCEYDIDPPNPVSQAFHRQFGFAEVGRQSYNGKQVALQRASSSL